MDAAPRLARAGGNPGAVMQSVRESWSLASEETPAVGDPSGLVEWEDAVRALERWLAVRVGTAPSRRTSTWTRVGAARAHPSGIMPAGTFVVHRIVLSAPIGEADGARADAPLSPLDLQRESERSAPELRALLLEGYGHVRRRGGHLVVLAEAGNPEAVREARVYVPAETRQTYAGAVDIVP